MSRTARSNIAQETLAICEARRYAGPSGLVCELDNALTDALGATELYRPGDRSCVRALRDLRLSERAGLAPARTEVRNETTLAAARRLRRDEPELPVLALNFASALYPCLLTQPDYYSANRACGTALYTDHMIYTPRVPVFRDDRDQLTEGFELLSFLTAPAPNAGALRDDERRHQRPTFEARMDQLLSWACALGYTRLVLGAWGCGVFRNDPAMVAELFAQCLISGGLYAQAFDLVAFGVLDSHGGATLRAFEAALA